MRFIPMGRFRLVAVACACMLLAACGGTTKQASIEHATANRLASASDAVAVALRRGDSCGAAMHAQALRSQVAGAIATGAIPHSLATQARTASSHLASSIVCPVTQPVAPVACPPSAADKQPHEEKKHPDHKHEEGRDPERKGCR
jgi:hypothetical protein